VTLVVAVTTDEGVWMGADRYAGSFHYTDLAHPKVFHLTGDGYDFLIGFAGAPRVAQTILAVDPPDTRSGSLHWWLTEYCDRIRQRCEDMSLLVTSGDCGQMVGDSEALVAIDGRVVHIGCDLAWEEPARGWDAMGGAAYLLIGAAEVMREQHDPVEAVRRAWPYTQRHSHVGDLVDELSLPGA
jgi:hypothetical protein